MLAYSALSKEACCAVKGVGNDGPYIRTAQRNRTQLSAEWLEDIAMGVEGLTIVEAERAMARCIIRFADDSEWTRGEIRPVIAAENLRGVCLLGDEHFSEISVREGQTASEMVAGAEVEKLFRRSGQARIYLKPAAGETAWQDYLEILRLIKARYEEALGIAETKPGALGLAMKGEGRARLGIRFNRTDRGKQAMAELANGLGLTRRLESGQFKLSGSSKMSHLEIVRTCAEQEWGVAEVIYTDGVSAAVSAKHGPPKKRFGILLRRDVHPVEILTMGHWAGLMRTDIIGRDWYVADGDGGENGGKSGGAIDSAQSCVQRARAEASAKAKKQDGMRAMFPETENAGRKR